MRVKKIRGLIAALLMTSSVAACSSQSVTGRISFDIPTSSGPRIRAKVMVGGNAEGALNGAVDISISPSSRGMTRQEPDAAPARAFPSHFQAPNVAYELSGKTRNRSVDPAIMEPIAKIADKMGLGLIVVSGGQDRIGHGGRRTGSTRHDVNAHGHGQAVDVTLTRAGKRLSPDTEVALHAAFIEAAAIHFPGIGHYRWGLHVGYGAEAFWGPDRTARTASAELLEAFRKGRAVARSN